MKRLAAYSFFALLSACAYGPPPSQIAPGSEVGGVGNVRYDHKRLNANTHQLTVHVSPGMLETESSMAARQTTYANEFAARTCPGRFDFIADPNRELQVNTLTQRTKIYTFRCS